jgi:galactokinase
MQIRPHSSRGEDSIASINNIAFESIQEKAEYVDWEITPRCSSMRDTSFQIRAPGRVCLFGEHSDYLRLDVIAAAIDLAIEITATPCEDDILHITYSDIGEEDTFHLGSEIPYRNRRDYFRSAFNVMARHGLQPKSGWDLEVRGDIPLAAGLSSSSALTVAAVMAIAQMAGTRLPEDKAALLAYDAEVVEFGESGGTMDHYASVFGGVVHVDMERGYVTRLPAELGSFIIGDSGETKRNTVGDLRYIRTTVEREYQRISESMSSFNRRTTSLNEVYTMQDRQPDVGKRMAEATLRNRDLTNRALDLLSSEKPDPEELGLLLNTHHEILREGLDRSTPKIERMIEAALQAGALGCKINGSGRGGTMMAYGPKNEAEIASAIGKAGGTTYIVNISNGAIVRVIN